LQLWQAVIGAGLALHCARCNFQVSSRLKRSTKQTKQPNWTNKLNGQVLDWNKPSIDFYERAGAVNLSAAEGWLSFRMDQPAMQTFLAK
jgi:hypothetical protein